MKITSVGIDLAKNVFQLHAVDERGKTVLRRQLRRDQMAALFANLPPCLIGMEACGSAHYWARTLQSFGHTARLMSPQFVKPYVKSNKNDVADAEANCAVIARPNMRLVPVRERRAAGRSVAASRAARLCRSPHGTGQPDPQSAGRVRLDHAGRHLSRCQARAGPTGRHQATLSLAPCVSSSRA